MRAVVWSKTWEDDYDDLSSFEPGAKSGRRVLPVPPLPDSATWNAGGISRAVVGVRGRRLHLGIALVFLFALTVGAGILFAWLQTTPLLDHYVAIGWTIAGLALYGLATVTVWHYVATGVAPEEVLTLAEVVGRRDVYPVRIRISVDGRITGVDRGLAWFSKDALHYQGLETAMVLGAQDLQFDPMAAGIAHGALQHGWVTPTLSLHHPDHAVSVSFQPIGRLGPSDKRDCGYRFRHNLRMFFSHWRQSHVPSVYPPLELQPSMRSRGRRAVVRAPEQSVEQG